jgi:hypothetical protein
MINRWKLPCRLLASALLLCCFALAAAIPPQKRVVKRVSRPNEPVQIISLKARGKAIEFGKPFPGENDWPGGLSFVIKNTSARSISWVRVALIFRKEPNGVRLGDFVSYGIGRWDEDKMRGGGPPLKPGETAELVYPLDQYQSLRELLNDMGFPQSIAQLEVSAGEVIFEDQPELMWIEGTMSEFHSPNGWRPVKP